MKEFLRASKANFVLLILLALGLVLYAFAGTWLTMRRVAEVENEGQVLEDRLQVQELLHPVYNALMRSFSEEVPAENLRLPEAVPLSREKLKDLRGLLQTSVRRAGLELKDVLPDSDGYNPKTQFLSLSFVVKGSLANFHRFLVAFGGLPFVERFFSLEILGSGEERTLRVHLQILVQQEEGLS